MSGRLARLPQFLQQRTPSPNSTVAQSLPKDSPSPGGEGRGEGEAMIPELGRSEGELPY
jgi:hypothetical protein